MNKDDTFFSDEELQVFQVMERNEEVLGPENRVDPIESWQAGWAEGWQEGADDKAKEIASALLAEGMDNRLILKVTGISDVVLSDVKAKKIDKE